MKEEYIKQVEKELCLPPRAKKEVTGDLKEIFASALEHGETARQVIQRLGPPKEFADNTAEQFGMDNAGRKKQRGLLSALAALIIAAAAFSIYAVTRLGKAPEGTIGQAMTNIQIQGALGMDVTQILLAAGVAGAVTAVLLIIRTIRKNRR